MEPDYQAGWVHRELCARLERFVDDVVNKRSPRLMIFMPPRVGKSMLASQLFPAWALGNHPQLEIASTSYAASLPYGFSRTIRRMIREDERYNALFPGITLEGDTQAVERWQVMRQVGDSWRIGGGYRAAGVGGPLTGTGCNILIVDDPVKNAEEAESEVIREATWQWYATTARTRLAPGGGILIIQTRWHDDDLSGRATAMMKDHPDADQFEIVSYPAIAEFDEPHRKAGEALHPDRYDERAYAQIRATVGPVIWNALYQQNPVPADGEFFKRDDIQYYKDLPPLASLGVIAAWDLAVSKNETADPTAGFVVGFDHEYNMYVIDRYYGRMNSLEICQQLVLSVRTWQPQVTYIEKEKAQIAIEPFLNRILTEEKMASVVIEPLLPGKRDKVQRARPLQGLIQKRKVFFPLNAEWTPSTVGELLRFPKGKHDDQVDALAYAAGQMDQVSTPDSAAREKQSKGWRDNLHKFIKLGSASAGHMAS
jgi:predicted phage terminase large subunit-like protein